MRSLGFMSDTVYRVSDYVNTQTPFFFIAPPRGSLDRFLAGRPAASPGLLPHLHLSLAGDCPRRLLPAPRPGRGHQHGSRPRLVRPQLLLLAPFLSYARPEPGGPDPALAADSPAPVPAAVGPGERPGRRVGRRLKAPKGGKEDARGQKPPPRVALQRQSLVYYGPLPASRRRAGPSGGSLLGRAGGRPDSRGRGVEQSPPADLAGQAGRLGRRTPLGTTGDGGGRRLLRRRQVCPRLAPPGPPSGHPGALQRRRLPPPSAPPSGPARAAPAVRRQNPPAGLVSLQELVRPGRQPGLRGKRREPSLRQLRPVVAALGPVSPLRLGRSPLAGSPGFALHRLEPAPVGDHPPLRLAIQNRGELQTSHPHRRRLRLPFLDAGHETDPARRRLATPSSGVRRLPPRPPPQTGRLRTPHPDRPRRPRIAPISGRHFPPGRLV